MNNTLVKGLQLLECLARSERAQGITDLAHQLGLGKSNVHRLLQALLELQYVQKDEKLGTYRVSLKLWELGMALESRLDIKPAASDAMKHLLAETRETVHLSLLDGDEVVYVAKLDSPEPVRAYSEVGGRAPAHCVATGKAILAWQEPVFLEGLAQRLARHTDSTLVDSSDFLAELERVRSQGYAVNRGEWRSSVWGVGAPIRSREGLVVAAIGISGPSTRVKPAAIKRLAAEVIAAAESVSGRLRG